MTNFELVIRPFQTRGVTPPVKIVGEPKEIETPILLIGSDSSKVFKLDVAISTNVEVLSDTTTYKETARTTETKRIENPDDPQQHVDVANTTSSELKDQGANPMSRKPTDKLKMTWKP